MNRITRKTCCCHGDADADQADDVVGDAATQSQSAAAAALEVEKGSSGLEKAAGAVDYFNPLLVPMAAGVWLYDLMLLFEYFLIPA